MLLNNKFIILNRYEKSCRNRLIRPELGAKENVCSTTCFE